MKPPAFWQNPPERPGWQAFTLAPIGALYAAATRARISRGPAFVASVPVICIGNINAGGTGKTPTAMALAQRLAANGPHIVSRGYGGKLEGPVQVDPAKHKAADVGDEPLLLSAFAPTWVAKDRAAGVRAAQDAGAGVILLDDGFQNPAVRQDVKLVVIDASQGFGNGRVIPAGPLREPVETGLARADVTLLIGKAERFRRDWPGVAVDMEGALKPLQTGMTWTDLPVLAFAGIGRPEKFFATLRGLGANLIHAEPLDDHQPLTDALMTRLEMEAKARRAQLVTTEKDAVRLPDSFRAKVLTVPVRLEVQNWEPLDSKLRALGLQPSPS